MQTIEGNPKFAFYCQNPRCSLPSKLFYRKPISSFSKPKFCSRDCAHQIINGYHSHQTVTISHPTAAFKEDDET